MLTNVSNGPGSHCANRKLTYKHKRNTSKSLEVCPTRRLDCDSSPVRRASEPHQSEWEGFHGKVPFVGTSAIGDHPKETPFTEGEHLDGRYSHLVEPPLSTPDGPSASSTTMGPDSALFATSPPQNKHLTMSNESASQISVETSHPQSQALIESLSLPLDILWKRFQRQRIDTWTLRSELHLVRANLRGKQKAKVRADDALFKFMRGQELLGPDHRARYSLAHDGRSLAELMQDCQTIRDEYGPLEDDCNQLEDRLSNQESKQGELEGEFYKLLERRLPELQGDISTQYLRDVSPAPSILSEDLEISSIHPLAKAFLSKLGDTYLLYEELSDLTDEKNRLEAEANARLRISWSLSSGEQAFLDNFVATKAQIEQKISSLETELEGRRQDCRSRGLIDENDEPTSLISQEKGHFSDEEGLRTGNTISEYVKFPVLLPRPGGKLEVDVDIDSLLLEPDEVKHNRVNQWLLDNLRSSPLEVRLLASTFEDLRGEPTERWQFYVLSVWYKDGTKTSSAAIQAYSSSSVMTHAKVLP